MPKIIIYGLITGEGRKYRFIDEESDDEFFEFNVKKGVSVQQVLKVIRKNGYRIAPVNSKGDNLGGVVGYDERKFEGKELNSVQFEKALERKIERMHFKYPDKGE